MDITMVAWILYLDPVLDIVFNIEYEPFTSSVLIHPDIHPLDLATLTIVCFA